MNYTIYGKAIYNSRGFIVGYEISDNKIIVSFANKSKCLVPYNEESEKEILKVMKGQVKDAS